MAEFLDKLTSYNLFNYLLPGVVFAVCASGLTGINFIQEDLVVGAFFYYFLGVVISRIGSLFIEPVLKWIKFIRFESYEDYLSASKKDDQISVLLEANNMYRTLLSTFICLLTFKAYLVLEGLIWKNLAINGWTAVFALALLFLFSYRKQTKFIASRIRKQVDGE